MASYFGGFWAVMALIIGEIGIIIYMTADL